MMMPSIFGESLLDDVVNAWDMNFPWDRSWNGKKAGFSNKDFMKTDVKEKEQTYELSVDIPGYKKDEVTAQLNDGYLTIMATKNENHDEKDADGKYIRRERFSGSCSRSFYVGDNVKQEDIKAKFENGILTLSVPKEVENKIENTGFIAIEG